MNKSIEEQILNKANYRTIDDESGTLITEINLSEEKRLNSKLLPKTS